MIRRLLPILLVICLACLGGAAAWWRYGRVEALPSYVFHANGRLEMTRIDIAVEYPGRVIELPIREGEVVAAGAVVARQDVAEIQAQLAGAEAQHQRAQAALARANGELAAHREGEQMARLEWSEAAHMRERALVSQVELDRRHIALDGESAAVAAAEGAVGEATAAVAEAQSQIARLSVVINDHTIRAPVAGRIEYRIVERDAVLPAGGRVAALLQTDDVYMTVFLPSDVAGKIQLGDEARIVLDALPDQELPATISFVSPEAQFTPKYVETASEREKLVYRVKLHLSAALAQHLDGMIKAGMTGNGFVRTDAGQPWPTHLNAMGGGLLP